MKTSEDFYKVKIEDVVWTITERCYGRCKHCHLWKKRIDMHEELRLDEIEAIFSNTFLRNLIQVHITGGEPHISPNYIPALEIIVRYHPLIRIHSPISGMFPNLHYSITKYIVRKITNNYLLDVSIDGPEEVNDSLRGNGMFERAVETIEMLKRLDLQRLRIQFTVYPENYKYIKWAKDFSEKLGVGLYINFGRASVRFAKDEKDKKVLDEFYFTKDQIEEIDKQLREIGFDKGLYKWRYIAQMKWWSGDKFYYDCLMGYRSFDIDPYGNVYPCLLWKKELFMGNIRNFHNNIYILYNSQRAMDVLEYVKQKRCQPCSFTCATKMIIDGVKAIGLK